MLLTLKRKNRKGFTLIELIVVVAILAILAAIAVPSFIGLQAKAEAAVLKADAATVAGQINVYNALSDTATKISSSTTAAAALSLLQGAPGGTMEPVISSGNTFAQAYGAMKWVGGVATAN